MNLFCRYHQSLPDALDVVAWPTLAIKRIAVASIKLFMFILALCLFLPVASSCFRTESLSSEITETATVAIPLAGSQRFHRDCGYGTLSVEGTCQPIEEALAASGGRVFWVAQENPNANDTNPGTRDWPWLTIGRAARELLPGDAVIVRQGIYREAIHPVRGGTDASHRITYAAYTGEQVIISGAELLTDWKPEGNVWRHTWTITLPPYERTPLDTDPLVLRRELLMADGVILRAVGSLEALVPGSYFVEDPGGRPTAIYLRLPNDASPADHVIEASQRELLFGVLNSSGYCSTGGTPSWLRVIGFSFRHAATPPRASAICAGPEGGLFEENNVEWNTGSGINFSGRGHILRGNRANDNGRGGMTGGCEGCLLEYNQTLRNNWKGFSPFWSAGGIEKMYQSRSTTIRGHESGYNNGVGIWLDIENDSNVIENSIVYGNLVAGILLEYKTTNTIVRNNILHGNRIIGANGPGTGLFVQAASHNTVVHNTFIANEGSGIFIRYDGRAPNGNNQIVNNIFTSNGTKCTPATCHDRGVELYLGGADAVNAQSNKLNGNLYWHPRLESPTFYFAPGCEWLPGCHSETNDLQRWRELVSGDRDSAIGDALLEDSSQLSGWHITHSSPAIKMGVTPPVVVAVDLEGDVRPETGADVGADQFKVLIPTSTPTPTKPVGRRSRWRRF